MFDPLGAIATLINGVHRTKKEIKQKDRWFRFGMSIFGTAFIAFSSTAGGVITAAMTGWEPVVEIAADATEAQAIGIALAQLAYPLGVLVLGVGAGLGSMAVMVWILWARSPLTKGIPIVISRKTAEDVLEQQQEGSTYTGRGAEEKKK